MALVHCDPLCPDKGCWLDFGSNTTTLEEAQQQQQQQQQQQMDVNSL